MSTGNDRERQQTPDPNWSGGLEEGGTAPGEHGSEPGEDLRLHNFHERKRRYDAERAGEGGLEPGIHGRPITDEPIVPEPSVDDPTS